MQEKLYFSFFILCAILFQGTLAKFPEEGAGESSKLLVRQKRVFDRSEGGDTPLQTGDAPYVINLKKLTRLHCVGTILSHRTAITAARCVISDLRSYTVFSGTTYSFRGNRHSVTDRKMHAHDPSRTPSFMTGIALITVNPPFEFTFATSMIGLHTGLVLAGMEGTVTGWGTHVNSGPIETVHGQKLRSITVPIMDHRECVNIYRGHFPITEEDICTHHPQKFCGDTDTGAPLVLDNELLGVYTGFIATPVPQCPIKPDVFTLLQHSNNRPWILSNIVH